LQQRQAKVHIREFTAVFRDAWNQGFSGILDNHDAPFAFNRVQTRGSIMARAVQKHRHDAWSKEIRGAPEQAINGGSMTVFTRTVIQVDATTTNL